LQRGEAQALCAFAAAVRAVLVAFRGAMVAIAVALHRRLPLISTDELALI
jgi:cell division protein FtsN